MLTAFKFYGVKNFKMTDVTILDQKRYALLMGNWEDVYMENINLALPGLVPATNQDGLHFHSPGRNLVIKNIYGRTGDDMIAINGDEGDGVTSIDGVLIDGVYLKGSTQGIRLLCKERGTLKNVSINHVYGEIDSFAFYINPWFWGAMRTPGVEGYSGKFENISIENVDVVMKDPVYTYSEQMLFCLGGDIENLRIRSVSVRSNQENFRLLTLREGHGSADPLYRNESPSNIKKVSIDGVYARGTDSSMKFEKLFAVEGVTKVEDLTLSNIYAENTGDDMPFLSVDEFSEVNTVRLENLQLKGFGDTVKIKGICKNII